jgi:hypothetical protein
MIEVHYDSNFYDKGLFLLYDSGLGKWSDLESQDVVDSRTWNHLVKLFEIEE